MILIATRGVGEAIECINGRLSSKILHVSNILDILNLFEYLCWRRQFLKVLQGSHDVQLIPSRLRQIAQLGRHSRILCTLFDSFSSIFENISYDALLIIFAVKDLSFYNMAAMIIILSLHGSWIQHMRRLGPKLARVPLLRWMLLGVVLTLFTIKVLPHLTLVIRHRLFLSCWILWSWLSW